MNHLATSRLSHVAATLLGMAILVVPAAGHAQQFINLDFEMATVPSGANFLTWEQAAPGWEHSTGTDTRFVDTWQNPFPPLPASTQQFLLRESGPSAYRPPNPFAIQGRYAMDFQSGYEDPSGSSEWVQAYLLQTGEVPTDAKSIHLLASGDFMVTLDEQLIPMRLTESSSYVGDISQFAGRVATLKITNLTNSYNTSVVLDDIRFSPMSAVPEPSSWALMALGLAGVGMAVRGKRRLATLGTLRLGVPL
jgi:PEP-CTERM motif-containing protein